MRKEQMIRIKIKNFGPIKNGYLENDGWLEVNKVNVFIGNQGSGKSTIAKLISSFLWLEKALIRGDIKMPISHQYFDELISFHRLENYIKQNTEIEFEGNTFRLVFHKDSTYKNLEIKKLNNKTIKQPKIMYVPAERNFLSSISNINKVSDLIVGSLKNYSVEFRNAQLTQKGKPIDLPINNTKVFYDSKDDENYLIFDNKRLKLSEASSGFHSIVPLHWVTKYLIDFVKQEDKKLLELLSTDQTIRRNNELKELNVLKIDEKELRQKVKKINEKYVCKYLINIVEEPEQNLFPNSQQALLYRLLAFNNGNNMLIMTTHSPFLINYLTLAVKANMVLQKLVSEDSKEKLSKVVPIESTLNPEKLSIYELNELEGTIVKLSNYHGLPSDENFLNNSLEESNELFTQLQEIEKGWR